MKINKILIIFVYIFLLISCSKDEVKKSVLNEKSLDLQVLEVYKGLQAI